MLLPAASRLEEADARLVARITPPRIDEIVALIPDVWLTGEPRFHTIDHHRGAYREYLRKRLEPPRPFLEEAIRARTQHV